MPGTIPTNWNKYKVPKAMAISGWIPNFSQRLAQLEKVAQLGSFTGLSVWLGGLFFPEAYITATRQAVAHRMSWSLETLDLRLDMEQEGDPTAFAVEGENSSSFV
jgi:dynein heavy chain 1, cytosolic